MVSGVIAGTICVTMSLGMFAWSYVKNELALVPVAVLLLFAGGLNLGLWFSFSRIAP